MMGIILETVNDRCIPYFYIVKIVNINDWPPRLPKLINKYLFYEY